MEDLKLIVDGNACVRCGQCVKDCPNDVLLMDNGEPAASVDAADTCIECQHCLAVCPTGALSVFGLNPQDSIPLRDGALPTREKIKTLVRGRRSVRQYREADVSGEVIDEILADLAHAPTGCNDRALDFLVVDDRLKMQTLRESVVSAVESAIQERRQMPDFLISAVDRYRQKGIDDFFRGAPHLLVVSAAERASCGKQDVVLSLAYFDLLAQCAGLGTTWCGFLDFVAATVPKTRAILGLDENVPFYSMMFGYPAVKYARTVQRDSAATMRRFPGR